MLLRDWCGLPEELVTIIGEKASSTNAGYIHLRLVCKAWRRALPPNPRHLPPQAPWLMLPRIPGDVCRREGSDYSDELIFYDPFLSKTHTFQLPFVSGKHICGSSYGWFVLEHDLRFSLFNPITQSTIDLPSFDAPPTFFNYEHSGRFVLKAILSGNPSDDGCFVVAWFSQYTNWALGFCRIGDAHWTCLQPQDMRRMLLDFTCHKNMVYTVNRKKEVSLHNLHNLSVRTFPSKIRCHSMYDKINLVEGDSESGEPLVVKTTKNHGMTEFSVYKWFDDRQQWCQVRNIGKRVIFFNWGHSINLQLEGGQENELYYDVRCPLGIGSFRLDINRVHLESGNEFSQTPSPTKVFRSLCGEPMWVTPSLI